MHKYHKSYSYIYVLKGENVMVCYTATSLKKNEFLENNWSKEFVISVEVLKVFFLP